MKLEKRGEVTPEEAAAAAAMQQKTEGKHKPVLLYLVILFAIAIVLILISFAMNQHSNAARLQELQSQVETLQQLQDIEEKYKAECADNETLRQQVQTLSDQAEASSKAQQALSLLWELDRLYTAGDTEGSRKVLSELKKDDLYLSLPEQSAEENTTYDSPRAAFDRMDSAINGDQAE